MTSEVRLLGRGTSNNVQKVLWLLAEIGRPYRQEDYGGSYGRTKDADYLSLNPNGTVPTLVDGDFVVWESNTILRYLAEDAGADALYPRALKPRIICDQWLDWQNSTLAQVMSPLYKAIVRTEPAKRDQAAIDGLRERARVLFAILDHALDRSPCVAGSSLSLADIAIGPMAYRWYKLGLSDPETKRLEAWYHTLGERPAFRTHVMVELV
ncbi:MAG: glutathione S-transferase family protein [Methylovirgula sp.]